MKKYLMLLICMAPLTSWSTEFAVSPMLLNIAGSAGQQEPFEINVAGKETGRIKLSAFAMSQELSGHMSFKETNFDPDLHQAIEWIKFESNEYAIRKGETTIVKGVLSVPRTTKGTYLAAIMVEEDPEESSTNVSIKVRYAVILNIQVGSPPSRLVTQFENIRIIEEESQTLVEATFKNQNMFLGFLDSSVQIRDENKKLVARASLKTESARERQDSTSRVYPGSVVKLVAVIDNLDSGVYSVISRNRFNGKMQPIYREDVAFTSSRVKEDVDQLVVVGPTELIVKQRASGLSLTQISLKNPSDEDVTILLPEAGSSPDAGVSTYQFLPNKFVLKPGSQRRVMLKQKHQQSIAYNGTKFMLAASSSSGRQESHVLELLPEGETL